MNYQPRYIAYCRAQGIEPEQMLEADQERWPGGCMCGFILWINEKWAEWGKETGHRGDHFERHHKAFDRWLGIV